MKKLNIVILSFVICFSLTACQSKQEEQKQDDTAFITIDAIEDGDPKVDETIKGDVLIDKAIISKGNKNVKNLSQAQCDTIEKKLVTLINKSRSSQVKSNSKLEKSSMIRAKELQKKFSHTRPNKKSWTTSLTQAKVSSKGNKSGENLAKLSLSAKKEYTKDMLNDYANKIHSCLMNSATHKKVIQNKNYKFIGVSLYSELKNGKVTFYITQHFTKKC